MLTTEARPEIRVWPINEELRLPPGFSDLGGFQQVLRATLPAVEIVSAEDGEGALGLDELIEATRQTDAKYLLIRGDRLRLDRLTAATMTPFEERLLMVYGAPFLPRKASVAWLRSYRRRQDAIASCLQDWEPQVIGRFSW